MKLFDAHCHLQMHQFDADRGEVLERMREANMSALVVGTDFEVSSAGLELAKQYDFLYAAVGLHPNDTVSEEFDSEKYEALACDPKVVAIGECGLDYFRSGSTDEEKMAQRMRFVVQAKLAQKVGKALIIHCRDAHDDMIGLLKELKLTVSVVIHFCTVSGEVAKQYLDLGCYLSFPGPVTITSMYDDSISLCPLDRMLIETDSPFAAPKAHRGQRNEPVYVAEIAEKVASIKGISASMVSEYTVNNARVVFGL